MCRTWRPPRLLARQHRALVSLALAALVGLLGPLPAARPAASAPGDFDSSFGAGGRATVDFGGRDEAYAMILQPDGKLVAAGLHGTGGDRWPDASDVRRSFALARFGPDGTLDPAFGQGGKVTTAFEGAWASVKELALQPDGKLVAMGQAFRLEPREREGEQNLALARYHPDGSLDPAFGDGGTLVVGDGEVHWPKGFVIQPDGRLVAAWYSFGFMESTVLRLNGDGTKDRSFGAGGRVVLDRWGVNQLAVQPDGKLVLVGSGDSALLRLRPAGSPDIGFGVGGRAAPDFGAPEAAQAQALLVLPDGKLLVAGDAYTCERVGDAGTCERAPNRDVALARYNADGSPDRTFGADGQVRSDFGDHFESATAVGVAPDGKIVVAGNRRSDSLVARYLADGAFDPSFGSGGWIVTDFDELGDEMLPAAVVQPDGKVVVVVLAGFVFMLARYEG